MIEALLIIAAGSFFSGVLFWELWFSEAAEQRQELKRRKAVKLYYWN